MKHEDEPPLIRTLGYEAENIEFNKRFEKYMDHFEELNFSMNDILFQVKTDTGARRDVVVNMLCRLCVRHFEGVLLLVMSGHGHSATRIMRSLFEKCVDAYMMSNDQEAFDDFWEYRLLDLEKEKGLAFVKELNPDYDEKKKARFFDKKKRRRPTWSPLNLPQRAEKIGMSKYLIDNAYRLSNTVVHSTLDEIFAHLVHEEDDTISPTTGASEQEWAAGTVALLLSTHLIKEVLRLLISHFDLVEPPQFRDFFEAYDRNFTQSA